MQIIAKKKKNRSNLQTVISAYLYSCIDLSDICSVSKLLLSLTAGVRREAC